mgnify:CR=1 FL=1
MNVVRAETVLAAMKLIAEGRSETDFESFGMKEEDWEKLRSPRLWLGADRSHCERIFQVLCHGVCDAIGASRYTVSAEYQAAVIVMFVHPANVQLACSWFEKSLSNSQLADGVEISEEMVSAAQLFALCLEWLDNKDVTNMKKRLERRTKMQLVEGKAG